MKSADGSPLVACLVLCPEGVAKGRGVGASVSCLACRCCVHGTGSAVGVLAVVQSATMQRQERTLTTGMAGACCLQPCCVHVRVPVARRVWIDW